MSSERIQVLCRVRPGNTHDRQEDDVIAWCESTNRVSPLTLSPEAPGTILSPRTNAQADRVYDFTRVLGPDKDNHSVFQAVSEVLESAVAGMNATVMAYGHTSAGKTHTMLGTPTEPGIIIRSVEFLLSAYAKAHSAMDVDQPSSPVTPTTPTTPGKAGKGAWGGTPRINASYYEIYMEKVWDLLSVERKEVDVYSVEDTPVVQNVTIRELRSLDDCVSVVSKGQENRRMARTTLNERSSRGHTIFQLDLHLPNGKYSQLRLVDLAGSENAKAAGTSGELQREGGAINKSLLALTNVIHSLASSDMPSRSNTFVPYRDAKLTRILQNSIGGNSKTRIICCVASKRTQYEDTVATLMFSERAKAVRNVVRANTTAPAGFSFTGDAAPQREPDVVSTFSSQVAKEKSAVALVKKYKDAAEEISVCATDLLISVDESQSAKAAVVTDEVRHHTLMPLAQHLLAEMRAEADLWREAEYQLQKKCYSLTESFQKKLQRMEDNNEKREEELIAKEQARWRDSLKREKEKHADVLRVLEAEHATTTATLREELEVLRAAYDTLAQEHTPASTEPFANAGSPPRLSVRNDAAWERKLQEMQQHHLEEVRALRDSAASSQRAQQAEHSEAVSELHKRLEHADTKLSVAQAELQESRESQTAGGAHPQAVYYKEKYEQVREELHHTRVKVREMCTVQRQCTERVIEAKTVQVTTRRSLKRSYDNLSGEVTDMQCERLVSASEPCPARRPGLGAPPTTPAHQPPRPASAATRTRTPQKQRSYSAATLSSTPKQRPSHHVTTPKSAKARTPKTPKSAARSGQVSPTPPARRTPTSAKRTPSASSVTKQRKKTTPMHIDTPTRVYPF